MGIELIGLITVALGGFAMLRSSAMALTVLCCMGLLGAASAMAFGGANITPGHLSLGFFVLAVIVRRDGIGYATLPMQRGGPGFVLLLLCLWGLVSGMFLPRLFAGELMVFPMTPDFKFIIEEPLYPSGSNFNHAVYFMSGLFVFSFVASMARTNEMMKKAGGALIIAGVVNLVIVLVDTVTFAVGASAMLDFIRNADYSQIFYHKFMGVKRVTGSFPEASAFAAVAVGLFAYNFRLWRGGVRTRMTGWVTIGTLAAILFSFSTTGYIALIVYLTIAYSSLLIRSDRNTPYAMRSSTNRAIFLSLGPLLVLAGATAVAIKPDLISPIVDTFDASITNKLGSASGVERTSWNMVGLRAFFETFGLGAGIGSVRTSSFLVGVLANLGIIGAVFFTVFLARLFLVDRSARSGLADNESRQYAAAARAGCFTIFVASAVSSSSVDLGIHFFVMAGLACASLFYRRVPADVVAPNVEQDAVPPASGTISARMRGHFS